jgi:hypothetical protein
VSSSTTGLPLSPLTHLISLPLFGDDAVHHDDDDIDDKEDSDHPNGPTSMQDADVCAAFVQSVSARPLQNLLPPTPPSLPLATPPTRMTDTASPTLQRETTSVPLQREPTLHISLQLTCQSPSPQCDVLTFPLKCPVLRGRARALLQWLPHLHQLSAGLRHSTRASQVKTPACSLDKTFLFAQHIDHTVLVAPTGDIIDQLIASLRSLGFELQRKTHCVSILASSSSATISKRPSHSPRPG